MREDRVLDHPAALERSASSALTARQPQIFYAFALARRVWPLVARDGRLGSTTGVLASALGAAADIGLARLSQRSEWSRRTRALYLAGNALDAVLWARQTSDSAESALIGAAGQLERSLEAGFRSGGLELLFDVVAPAAAVALADHLVGKRVRPGPLILTSLGALPGQMLTWLEREEIQAAIQQDEQYTAAVLESALSAGWQLELADGQTPVGEYLEHATRVLFFAEGRARSVKTAFAYIPPEEERLRNAKQTARSRMRFSGTGADLKAVGLQERSYWSLGEAVEEINMRVFNPRLSDSVIVKLSDEEAAQYVISTALVDKLTVALRTRLFLGEVTLSLVTGRTDRVELDDGVYRHSIELERGTEMLPPWVFDARFIGLAAAAVLTVMREHKSTLTTVAKAGGSLGLVGLAAAVWYRGHTSRPLPNRQVVPFALALAAAGSLAEAASWSAPSAPSRPRTPGRWSAYAMAHVLGAYWSDIGRIGKVAGAASVLGVLSFGAVRTKDLRTLAADALWLGAPMVSASAAHSIANGVADQFTERRRAHLRERADAQVLAGRAAARAWLRREVQELRNRLSAAEDRYLLTDGESELVRAELDTAEAILKRRGDDVG
jgi:hypothetical protein